MVPVRNLVEVETPQPPPTQKGTDMNEKDIPLAPIAGWTTGPVPAYGAVILRLDYLTHPMQQIDEATQSPHFLLTAAQALELSEALKKHAAGLQDGPPQGTGLPKH